MRRTVFFAVGAALCAAPLVLSTPLQAAQAQTKAAPKAAAKAGAYRAPRNAFGQPDLGVYWTNATMTPESRQASFGTRSTYTREEIAKLVGELETEITVGNAPTDPNAPPPSKGGAPLDAGLRPQFAGAGAGVGGYNRGWLDPGSSVMYVHGEPRTSLLTTPDGRPPARKASAAAAPGRGGGGAGAGGRGGVTPASTGSTPANPEDRPLGERCIISFGRNGGPPMLPNGFYNNNYHIVQSRDAVAIDVEMVHDTRIVRLNAKHRTDGVRPWFGDSIGHFEGETLVVETTNIPQAQAYNGSWENLTVTEKFTRVGKDRLFYQYTINDPTIWDAAWGGEYEFGALGPGQRVEEYACHEGNYAMEDMLAGARAEEAAARSRAAR